MTEAQGEGGSLGLSGSNWGSGELIGGSVVVIWAQGAYLGSLGISWQIMYTH